MRPSNRNRSATAPLPLRNRHNNPLDRANTVPLFPNKGRNKGQLRRGTNVEFSYLVRIARTRKMITKLKSIMSDGSCKKKSFTYLVNKFREISNSLYKIAEDLRDDMPGDTLDTFQVSDKEIAAFNNVVAELEKIAENIGAIHLLKKEIPEEIKTGRNRIIRR